MGVRWSPQPRELDAGIEVRQQCRFRSAWNRLRCEAALGIDARLAGVSITLGSTTLQRIRSVLYSAATACANAITAAFEAM